MSTSHTDADHDRGMLKAMAMVMLSLCVLSIIIVMMARLLSLGSDESASDSMVRNALISRIQPVGAVRTSAENVEVAAADTGSAAERSGEDLVNGVCAGCHAASVAGAPKLGDEAAWGERRGVGLDALVASAIHGKGNMPARGGSGYSDEEMKRAVEFIAMFEPSSDGAADDTAGDADAAAGDEADATTDEEASDATTDEASDEPAASDASAGAEVDLAALVASGEVPEGLSAEAKTAADTLCTGCHAAGVANAPKLGDAEAWGARASAGIDALTQTVITGKGAMPPRGGSQLSDEDISAAIVYLLAKQ